MCVINFSCMHVFQLVGGIQQSDSMVTVTSSATSESMEEERNNLYKMLDDKVMFSYLSERADYSLMSSFTDFGLTCILFFQTHFTSTEIYENT